MSRLVHVKEGDPNALRPAATCPKTTSAVPECAANTMDQATATTDDGMIPKRSVSAPCPALTSRDVDMSTIARGAPGRA
jgi:hypothetical protein